MAAFVVRRLLSGLGLILLLAFLTYLVFEVIPVNPACLRVACGPSTHSTDADLRAANHTLGVDRPIVFQYGRFLWRFLRHGSLGTTWIGEASVNQAIGEALPITASIVLGGVVILLLLAVPLGCLAALRPRSPLDRGVLAFGVLGVAVHPFVLAYVLARFLAPDIGLPIGGYCPLTASRNGCGGPIGWGEHLVLPWICFALFFLPLYVRMIRVRLLETLSAPYVVTARAKGATERRVVLGHVLRNAIGPVLPMAAADAGTALTAAIYIEVVFSMPGLGRLAVTALGGASGGYDRPLVVGIVCTVAAFVVLLSVASDIGTAWLDPRVRLRSSAGLVRLPGFLSRHEPSRRTKRILAGAGVAIAIAGGFAIYTSGSPSKAATLIPPTRTLHVNWTEDHQIYVAGESGSLTVRVRKVEFGRRGWRITGGVTNKLTTPIQIYAGGTDIRQSGFALTYAERSQGYNTLVVANASDFRPALPNVLQPGASWNGTWGGIETIPPGRQFYVGVGVFGPVGLQTQTLFFGASVVTNGSGITPKRPPGKKS
ncbi:MAG TPA: ABC transporter permease [Gaiellaceae bacterium]|nr:ABC transporter permease [Gaiellaceae bacterium]